MAGEAKAERRAIAVLYAELRNFTRLSEVLDPGRVMELANEFFDLAARHMGAGSGRVLGVQNDALLAVFSAAPDALTAAQALQHEFPLIGERWKSDYGLPAAVALGGHYGEAVLGMAGARGALRYAAFGDCVSVAERILHRARPGEIVLSGDLVAVLGVAPQSVGASVRPALELARRPAIPLYGIELDTGLDFT